MMVIQWLTLTLCDEGRKSDHPGSESRFLETGVDRRSGTSVLDGHEPASRVTMDANGQRIGQRLQRMIGVLQR